MKNYYKILEVQENASEEEIKKSYRNLSKKYHPDVNPDGAEKFTEINEAYEVLKDKSRRDQYDFSLKNPNHGSYSIEDLIKRSFGGDFNFGGDFGFRKQNQAPDQIIKLEISPIESYKGVEKTFFYNHKKMCEPCSGSGGDKETCSFCNGSGQTLKTFGNGFIMQRVAVNCNSCNGRGFTFRTKCYICNGEGTQQESKQLKVKIPKNIDNGEFLKLRGVGNFANGNYGDLVIQIQLAPKDGYEKMGNDLIYNLFLNLEELNQEKLTVPHPDGDLILNFPKVFDTSKPLRLKNKGYADGDMYIKLYVKFEKS